MKTVRIPLPQDIGSRDSTTGFDALAVNCFLEKEQDGSQYSVLRFGLTPSQTLTAGQSLGMFAFNSQPVTVIGGTLRYSVNTQTGLDTNSQYQFAAVNQPNTKFIAKNNANAYVWTGSAFAKVTDVNYPATTVPGVVYLDGTTYVMDQNATIWGSALNDPQTWQALNFISANAVSNIGVALTRYLNYVVAFCDESTAFFTDVGNPTGSPLAQNVSSFNRVGCASGTSVVSTQNTVYWIGKTRQKGRSVYMFNGTSPVIVSNQYIDRILNVDNLSTVYAYALAIDGHDFYILTLKSSNITLVFDSKTGDWHTWSSTSLGATRTASSATYSGAIVTVTLPSHGLVNGSIVSIGGVAASQFLGTYLVNVIDSNTFFYTSNNFSAAQGGINTFPLGNVPINGSLKTTVTSGITSLTVTPYVQNYFSGVFYANTGQDLILNETSGIISTITEGLTSDNGAFIYRMMRTNGIDFGSNKVDFYSRAELIADKVPGTAYIGYTDNDYQSFSYFRPVNLQANRSQLRRCGAARRRSWQIIYFGNYSPRFYEIELDVDEGTM